MLTAGRAAFPPLLSPAPVQPSYGSYVTTKLLLLMAGTKTLARSIAVSYRARFYPSLFCSGKSFLKDPFPLALEQPPLYFALAIVGSD